MRVLTALLFPQPRRRLRHGRALNIAARTVHLAATGTLLGGHVVAADPGRLVPLVWVAVATGAVMMAVEIYPTAHWAHQVCALFVYAKLLLLGLVPFLWEHRVALLLAAVALASVGSHAPRRVRHYSVWYRRVMAE
ncbi:MAG TPA: hypothetical protein PLE61_08455 [Vicinamibacterales bacterium]|nr:hypothetical protein [Vicinamibacterales bacterium]HPW20832.1 hypothetical protein [Vicinamibacterales bacterium]